MLGNFHEKSIPVLGIDPADAPVAEARKKGIETLCTFFTEDLAASLVEEGRQADVIIANNVLAHVADLNGFVRGLGLLLKNDGIASIEFPYVVDLVQHNEFDTIYHQHLCYFSVTALVHLFAQHGLCLRSVDRIAIHGGSLRLTIAKQGEADSSVQALLEQEQELKFNATEPYLSLAKKAEKVKADLLETLKKLSGEGARIAAYAAAAKGTTLLSYCSIGAPLLEYVVDLNPNKHGRYLPGASLEICPVQRLLEDRPDYVLILAWNFKDEILKQQSAYREGGGKFIVPIPEVEIV
jgi:SAM-dependent methyltransferase